MKGSRFGVLLFFGLFLSFSASALETYRVSLPTEEIFIRWNQVEVKIRNSVLKKHGLKKLWESSSVSGLKRYSFPKNADVDDLVHELSKHPGIQYAEENRKFYRYIKPIEEDPSVSIVDLSSNGIGSNNSGSNNSFKEAAGRPNDPYYRYQWALNSRVGISIDDAWEITKGSMSVKVAVIDTGVDSSHPDLKDRVVAGYDFINRSPRVKDTHGHGTHVSGIIGARMNNKRGISGINAEVTIIPIRAVPNDGDETDADVIASFDFAAKKGARIANCSFGKKISGRAVGDTIEAAGRKGVLAIVSAGTDGVNLNSSRSYPASFQASNMLVIASSSSRDRLSSFSNFGIGKVHIAAPGSEILSTVTRGRYASWSGTSMASPQVSGVAALAVAAFPKIKMIELRNLILKYATKVPNYRNRIKDGLRINAGKVVQEAKKLAELKEKRKNR